MMSYGERIRQLRIARGMTLEQLGQKIGKSKQWVFALENGLIRLTYDMAATIAGIFEMTPDDIFMSTESKNLGHARGDKETSANG